MATSITELISSALTVSYITSCMRNHKENNYYYLAVSLAHQDLVNVSEQLSPLHRVGGAEIVRG